MMKYELSDFKDLVELWYNEFLPTVAIDKSYYMKETETIYVNWMPSNKTKEDSIGFFLKNAIQLRKSPSDNVVFIRDPKPVNNIKLKNALKRIESHASILDDNKTRIFHLANHRYYVSSSEAYVAQWKEIDLFLDDVFRCLVETQSKVQGIKFYQSESFGFSDAKDVFLEFFPRNSIELIQETNRNSMIKVCSTAVPLTTIFNGIGMDSSGQIEHAFFEQAKKVMMKDIESLI